MEPRYIDSNGVIERAATVPIYRIADLSGAGSEDIITFDARIVWLVEQHVMSEATHGGKHIKRFSQYGDVGRFGQCIDHGSAVFEEAQSHMRWFDVTRKSSLEIRIVTWQTVQPVLEAESVAGRRVFGRERYKTVPGDWHISRRQAELNFARLKGTESASATANPLEAFPSISERHREVIWSSQMSDEENARRLAAYTHVYVRPVASPAAGRKIYQSPSVVPFG